MLSFLVAANASLPQLSVCLALLFHLIDVERDNNSVARPANLLRDIGSHAVIKPGREYDHSPWNWLVVCLCEAITRAFFLRFILRLVHHKRGARIDKLDVAGILWRLDVVHPAPEAVWMAMGSVAVARRIDNRPHGSDLENMVLRVGQIV